MGCDKRHVLTLLNILGAEHAPAGLADGHDVAVVAEDGKALAGYGTGGNMEDGRGQLTGKLVHVRHHQEQTLRSGKGGTERACCQRAVQGACNTAFRLHLGDSRDGSPDVFLAGGCLGISFRCHG